MQGSATSDNQFRVLWLGKRFVDALRPGLRPDRTVPYLVTGPDGLSLLDTAPPDALGLKTFFQYPERSWN